MRIAKPLQALIESFEKLPGIGPKSAQRLGFYLLHVPQHELDEFSRNLDRLKKDTLLCSICKNVDEKDPCVICSDPIRDKNTILVVEQPLDLIAFERSGKYKGLYHVLHGAINPLDNIGPDEIFLQLLLDRIKEPGSVLTELIIATNPTMEGEATSMYLTKEIKKMESINLKITRLGMGIPTGADLEYADDITLTQAIEGRREL
ncbi:MAG: Recombination protein RecR [Parcubacteria group bacterium GW2011_GWA1_38_7]|nr:MAG: Recombination protein RecR [Parcubacteria group bacterium GW2011_GWA1_38_7]